MPPPDGSQTRLTARSTGRPRTFYEEVTAAVVEFSKFGYDRESRLIDWVARLRTAALREMVPLAEVEKGIARALKADYDRLVTKGGLLQYNAGVPRFTLERVAPKMRAELDRRILANANLIKLHRQEAVEATLRRFQGWATSIPVGGSKVVSKVDTKANVVKPLRQLSYEDRRVAIDQGHKFLSALNEILAVDGGAIAWTWHSHWRQRNYNYRVDHKERDGHVYVIRGSWAHEKGYVKAVDGYTDEMTKPAEEVFCRCFSTAIFHLEDMPEDFLTQKGKDEIARVDAILKAA